MNTKSLLIVGASLCALSVHAAENRAAADNTSVNKRDRSDQMVTPEDQSQSKSDVVLAADIRRAVVAQPGISTSGQNIKIITQDGVVTLRGPVKNATELAAIEKTVRQAAGESIVNNLLEIK